MYPADELMLVFHSAAAGPAPRPLLAEIAQRAAIAVSEELQPCLDKLVVEVEADYRDSMKLAIMTYLLKVEWGCAQR